jgi:site-specific DNA-methyltransferase (adenine-specific)
MIVDYIDGHSSPQLLGQQLDKSIDAIILISGALDKRDLDSVKHSLDESIRVLKDGGLFFLQGTPDYLPELGVYLDQRLTFKYWIAIHSASQQLRAGLPTTHAAVLLFVKGNTRFEINKVRFPHETCQYCGKSLKDWGGKSHLMNPDGCAISDVWKNLPPDNNYTRLADSVLDTILKMLPARFERVFVTPKEGVQSLNKHVGEPAVQYYLPGFMPTTRPKAVTPSMSDDLWNVIHHGDAVEILRQYPDESIDLVFADPPYNLEKAYSAYSDDLSKSNYLSWCNTWLQEYIRILKPTGALFVLNLPRWTMYHASFLNQYLHFQNWIVWDALSEPRGKIMPAHYGLLFYTKSPTGYTFNYDRVGEIEPSYYCLRTSCIRKRKASGVDGKESLTDIWSDLHRIKHRRDRDYHPCQLPDKLLERIILLTTNEGDVVLDALAGTGTTAVVAAHLKRRYVAIDIDEMYIGLMKEKIALVENRGFVPRNGIRRPRPQFSKKDLQLELLDLANRLGRLPTPEDVRSMGKYNLDAYLQTFPTWGKALKAAKLEIRNNGNLST